MRQIIEFSVQNQGTLLVEVDEPISREPQRSVLKPGQLVVEAKESFEAAIEKVKPAAITIINKLSDMPKPPSEMEIKFGIKMSVEAGAVIAAASGEANFEITMTWKQPD